MEIINLTPQIVREMMPAREDGTAKWDFGRLLVVAGHITMPGAAALCASAATRSGVGLVRLASIKEVCTILATRLTPSTMLITPQCPQGGIAAEALPVILGEANACAATVLGPGMGRGEGAREVMSGLVLGCRTPMVIDADGLNLLSDLPRRVKSKKAPVILTPHVVEFSRLTGLTVETIRQNPCLHAHEYARLKGVTVVLKGADTVIAGPDGPAYLHSRDNNGLAKGGSGDVLAGLMGGLLAQLSAGTGPVDVQACVRAACCAVWLHGQAGWHAVQYFGPYTMNASDLINTLPMAFKDLFDGMDE